MEKIIICQSCGVKQLIFTDCNCYICKEEEKLKLCNLCYEAQSIRCRGDKND